jgi:zinc/manganese transport system substrate-binding protein
MTMRTNRLTNLSKQLLSVTVAFALSHSAHAALEVFACEPEWAAVSKEIGGEKVSVYQATSAMQDPHRIEARPSLIAHTRAADLLVCTGADLEVGWLPVLLQTSGNSKVQANQPGYFMASDFVTKLEVPKVLDRSQGDVHPYGNPHIQLDPGNIARVAKALSERLTQLDPSNASYYQARLKDFEGRWQKAVAGWESRAAPLKGMRLVPYHKDTAYLIHWLGMEEIIDVEPKPGIPPSAGYLSELLTKLQAQPADAITRSAYQDPKAVEWLSERTKIPAVTLPYTVGGTPQAKDLFSLFDDTIDRLLKARKPA